MEHIKAAPSDAISIYKDSIKPCISNFMDMYNIEDIKDIKPLQFNALLSFIHDSIFSKCNSDLLRDPNNKNSYNLELLCKLCDMYISLCEITVHSCSLYGYSRFTGIEYSTLINWRDLPEDGREATRRKTYIIKKIRATREVHEANRIEGTTIGDIAILNHEYSWNNPIQQTEKHQHVVSLDDIPRLPGSAT